MRQRYHTIDKTLKPVKFYRDDIEHIIMVLEGISDGVTAEIATRDCIWDSLGELVDKGPRQLDSLEIIAQQAGIERFKVDIQPLGVRLVAPKDSLAEQGVLGQLLPFCESHRIRPWKSRNLSRLVFFSAAIVSIVIGSIAFGDFFTSILQGMISSITLVVDGVIAPLFNLLAWRLGGWSIDMAASRGMAWAFLAAFIYVWQWLRFHQQRDLPSHIILLHRKDAPGFWEGNRDKIIVALISGLITGTVLMFLSLFSTVESHLNK
jgi:hypothetical protein